MINFSTNTILLITMFIHYTVFTRIVVAQHVFSFLATTTDIYLREHYVPMVLLSLPVVNSGVISLQRLQHGVSLKKDT